MADDANLSTAIAEFIAAAGTGSPVLIASDFDGVLAPLVDDPAQSRPLPQASAALARLAAAPPWATVALVSGRDLATLTALAGPPTGTHLIGSHGAELGHMVAAEPGQPAELEHTPLELTTSERKQLDELATGLEEIAAKTPGAWVEYKPAAAVLHTRLAEPELADDAVRQAQAVGAAVGVAGLAGKNVLEFAIIATTKGIALTALQRQLGATRVFYMGDDVTDEHAFERLQPADLTVRVGPGDTLARFRVSTPQDAADLLIALADAVEGHNSITA